MTKLQRFGNLLLGLLMIACGVVLLLDPHNGLQYVAIVLGLGLVLYGVRKLWYYIRMARHMTGGLSAMVLDLDVDALRGDLPVVQGDVRITTDIHRVLEDSPVLTSVVRTICEQGSVESQTVGEWYEWCQLGSDCPESEDDFKGVIEWLRSMHLLESMGPLSDGRITWATTIRPMTWAVRVFAGG